MAAAKGNQYAVGYGRPAKYETVEELEQVITDYFEYCLGEYETVTETVNKRRKNPETGKMEQTPVEQEKRKCIRSEEEPTVTGLALFLGFESRQSLKDYSKKVSFSYPIKRALLIIEKGYELKLPDAKGPGVIFALKNFGWEDKSTVDSNVNLKGKPDWLGVAASKLNNGTQS